MAKAKTPTAVTADDTKKVAPKKATKSATAKAVKAPKAEKAAKAPAITPENTTPTETGVDVMPAAVAPVEAAKPAILTEAQAEAPKAEKVETAQPAKPTTQSDTFTPTYDPAEMLEAGAHFGHQAKRWHPKMAPYIHSKKNGVHIIDLIKTTKQLETAAQYAYDLGREGKTLIFIGTKRQARDIVKSAAEEAGAMYIVNRWLGGFLTNWEQISKSLKQMKSVRTGLNEGKFNHYTKKERVMLDKQVQRQERYLGGVVELKTKPDAIFVVDIGHEKTAVTEATVSGVPMIAVVDTNCDPTPIKHVIPANDDAVKSVEYFVKAIADAYKAGRGVRK